MNKVGRDNCSHYYCCSSSSPPSTSSHQSRQLSLSNSPSDIHSSQATATLVSSHKRKSGRKKFRETRHPVYHGVRQRNGDRWVCEVREPNKKARIWLGTYPTPELAARAHDVAALALKGTSAIFNFPDSVSLLPVAKSSSAADLRVAASKVSKVFGPSSSLTSRVEVETTKPCLVDEFVIRTTSANVDDESVFFDEEAVYNMPGLLDSMAEGLLITPPSMNTGFDWDQLDCQIDLTLWTD
ncbi:hypothetical protein Fmac_019531 [Flemingia macrophylla]|uniref:AP2/ERF domain-containing protein n=1 Tax=Flemingia macrophylla TaxID=520843 RepID=A0ABD1M823_9FABA